MSLGTGLYLSYNRASNQIESFCISREREGSRECDGRPGNRMYECIEVKTILQSCVTIRIGRLSLSELNVE